jgi:predicted nucleic acid-binding protein
VKTPSLCVLDTSVASDIHAARLWAIVARLKTTFVIPQVVAVTEFRTEDWEAARNVGILVEPLSPDEESRAVELVAAYPQPSRNDLAALALAEGRRAVLLTGDASLRKAAEAESVSIHGVLWLLDLVVEERLLQPAAAADALDAIVGDGSRLPSGECQLRLAKWRG